MRITNGLYDIQDRIRIPLAVENERVELSEAGI